MADSDTSSVILRVSGVNSNARSIVKSQRDASILNALKHLSLTIARCSEVNPLPHIRSSWNRQTLANWEYAPGDTLTCNLTLIGEAINVLPWLVFTFYRMGEQRIGLRNQRGRCRLEKVESLPARKDAPSQTIFTSETEMLTDEGVILGLEDVMHAAPSVTDTIDLEFLTPTSIKVNGRWTSHLTFEHLIRNLLRRIRFLNYFHCGEDLDAEVDVHALIETARAVEDIPRLQWLRRDRYSHRAEASVPMSGFVGNIRFEGELAPFLPFIRLGEYLHIGHHTAFGYGQYRLTYFHDSS